MRVGERPAKGITPLTYPEIEQLLNDAERAATGSLDPSTKVGAVARLVDGTWAASWNHLCYGTPPEWIHEREKKYPHIVHAEERLVTIFGERLSGATVAVTAFPCSPCGKLLISAGVARVIARLDFQYEERWAESVKESQDRFNRAGVEYRVYERK